MEQATNPITFAMIVEYITGITTICTFLALLVKPVRTRLFTDKAAREGQKCLLRSEIIRLYYRHQETRVLRQYEYENLCQCYKAYKALGGNSFVKRIYEEMQEWDVVT